MHKSVLLEQSITILNLLPHDVVVDGTFGGGGHSRAILQTEPTVTLICVDLDESARERWLAQFGNDARVSFVHDNFKNVETILAASGKSFVNKVLLDLGTSTFQLLADTRGFSFQSDTPLSMTFSSGGSHTGFTAYDIVNTWQEDSIADIIFYYGEERFARTIARAIVEARADAPLATSKALALVIERAVRRRGKLHPATKTFQALRIAVNDELSVIEEALEKWWNHLTKGGRIAVITFHSLEDRIVKKWMLSKEPSTSRVITKKPITPTKEELFANKRARSAKLRAIEKIL